MKHQLYFPPRRGEQNLWLAHFREHLPAIATRLGIPEPEIAEALADLQWLLWVRRDLRTALDVGAQAAAAYERTLCGPLGGPSTAPPPIVLPSPPDIPPVPPGALKRVFKLVRRIKLRPDYTESLGKQLGIEDNHYRADSPVPTFRLRVETGRVVGKFSRYGRFGVWVETRRGGGDWEQLLGGIFTSSSFIDDRPLLDPALPEVRHYRLRFWENSHPVGEWTDVASATVSP